MVNDTNYYSKYSLCRQEYQSIHWPALTPRTKFLVFLVRSHLHVQSINFFVLSTDILIGLWTVGLLVQETKEIIRNGRERYFSQPWNIVTLVMIMLLVLAGILWLAGLLILREARGDTIIPMNFFVQAKQKTGHQLVLLSSSFFAVAYLFCFFNLAKAFQVNSTIGPMHLSLVNMINDIMKFLFLFLMVYLAFALALRKVYSQYMFAQTSLAKNSTHSSEHPFAKLVILFVCWICFRNCFIFHIYFCQVNNHLVVLNCDREYMYFLANDVKIMKIFQLREC